MEELNEKGFVFLDSVNRPYLCRIWGEENKPWLFWWHPDKYWVSHREVTQEEVWNFPRNLSEEEQNLYHQQVEKGR